MTNKDLITQYVDTGMGIPEYQFNKLSSSDKKTYLRKLGIGIKNNPNNIRYYYGDVPEDIQLDVVMNDPYQIGLLKNPTEAAQMAAFNHADNDEIDLVIAIMTTNKIELCDALQLALVDYDPSIMGHIKNQSEVAQMALIKKSLEDGGDENLVRFLKDPSDKVLLYYTELKDKNR